MFIIANFLRAIATVLDLSLSFVMFVLIAVAVLSWVNPDPYNPIVRFLRGTSEPLLRPVRRFMPTLNIGLDLSPLVLLLIIYFLRVFLVQSLMDYGNALRLGVL